MDERLIAASPRDVMRRMAEAYLAGPVIAVEQGEIRLAPHQVDAASRLLALLGEDGGAVLADATGLGKTFVAIAVARVMGPALIVAPASLRGMWRESLRRAGLEVAFVSYEALSRGESPRLKSKTKVQDQRNSSAESRVTSHESRDSVRPALLVLDEAHHARNPKARRYAAIADLAWGARVLMLSATPIHNRGRDLRALMALFVGSRALSMGEDEIRRLMVRRSSGSIGSSALPDLGEPEWLPVPRDHDTLRAIGELPPAVPASDGGTAHALVGLGLIRAWTSSEAALRASLRRRLRRAASFTAVLESGRVPERQELSAWPVVDDAIQLGFPELLRGDHSTVDVARVSQALDRHCDGVRSILRTLDGGCGAADTARVRHLKAICGRHSSIPIVAFTQFADTAIATFRSCVHDGGVALVTGRGARIASGRVSVEEIVGGFDIAERDRVAATVMPLRLLIATDVLSEGLSLRRAGVIVHLDLPWTMARLEQRVGRLRRIGSRHRCVHVYAIGPPVTARELLPVVRALQRKARLSSNMGDDELQSALPLLGHRLTRATSQVVQRGEFNAHESLRAALSRSVNGQPLLLNQPNEEPESSTGIALIVRGGRHSLVAQTDQGVSESPLDVLRAVRVLTGLLDSQPALGSGSRCVDLTAGMRQWLDEQRGRELARLATDASSPAHTDVLRKLQELFSRATRTERARLAARIERCRQLVINARGVGAEMAMGRMSGEALDIDALETLLSARAGQTRRSFGPASLDAVIVFDSDHECLVSAMRSQSAE